MAIYSKALYSQQNKNITTPNLLVTTLLQKDLQEAIHKKILSFFYVI